MMEEIYFSYNEALKCWNLIQNKDIARFYLYEVHEQTWTELSVGCRSRYWRILDCNDEKWHYIIDDSTCGRMIAHEISVQLDYICTSMYQRVSKVK